MHQASQAGNIAPSEAGLPGQAKREAPADPMKISQAFKFEAAHRLPNVPDTHRCSRLHGHSYRVEVQLDGPVDARTGFVVDFFDVEKGFADIMGALDHRCLNEVDGLENPTAENIAVWIWDRLQPGLRQISAVRVYETPDCWAEYDGR
jgi:6-pyruvoyltetrahydropterin/6-carboxytetrahydropterin synthase